MASPPSSGLSEDELANAALAGDAGAWDELVRRHYAPLLRFLTAQTGDREPAVDPVAAAEAVNPLLPELTPSSGFGDVAADATAAT